MLLRSAIFTVVILCCSQLAANEQIVVLFSIDGMRCGYIEKHGASNLAQLSKKGVRAKKLIPVYPTKTFSNHISIVTGLLLVNQGIAGNNFCDKSRENRR